MTVDMFISVLCPCSLSSLGLSLGGLDYKAF